MARHGLTFILLMVCIASLGVTTVKSTKTSTSPKSTSTAAPPKTSTSPKSTSTAAPTKTSTSPKSTSTAAPPKTSTSPKSTSTAAPPKTSTSPKSTSTAAPTKTSTSPKSTSTAAPPKTSTSPKSTSTAAPPKTSTSPKSTSTAAPPKTSTSPKSTSTAAPSKNSVLTPIFIPDTFYYNCTEEGDIHIINGGGSLTNLTIKYLNQSDVGNCTDPELQTDGSFVITNCTKNTTVDIVLEAISGTEILGGYHFKTFQIKCEDVSIKPYYLNVTFDEKISEKVSPHIINMATKPTSTPISNLTMTIKDNTTTVTEATIGQTLTIAITIPAKTSIKPTECKATGNGKKYILWQETGCKHDKEVFGDKWTNNGKDVTNTMYGFRFVGASKEITITCTVRVCPEGYGGHECELARCSQTKRKRINRLSDDVTMEKATASLAIIDPLLTSRAGRLGAELSNAIALFVAALAIVKVNFIRE
ncbi:uncharacterized protein LOC132561215 [Ylistrum balloti]|uniref:uncharacterized protein LOC132561215 n=1 Tax=Ylistrum balloti TaxID=509963 RepID=UPI002905F128|nr:uncharacterized protein LOC132561215 [Ylistrum balloti]